MGEVWPEIPSALHKSQDWHKVYFLGFVALLKLMIVLVQSHQPNHSAQRHCTLNTTINRQHRSQKSRHHNLLPVLNSNPLDLIVLDLIVYYYSVFFL